MLAMGIISGACCFGICVCRPVRWFAGQASSPKAAQLSACRVCIRALYLEHLDRDTTFLDHRFATQTLAYIAELWQHPVRLLTSDQQGQKNTLTVQPS